MTTDLTAGPADDVTHPADDAQNLADRTIRQIHDLVEELSTGRVPAAHVYYAVNALHLARDALLDLRALQFLIHDLVAQQRGLIDIQLQERIFHGPNHAAYHVNASQIRAVGTAGHQQAKRLLNQCAYVTHALVTHGTSLSTKSFGSQYRSIAKIDWTKVGDSRSQALLDLVKSRGDLLERHNDYRDDYIEHTKPLRSGQQPRPATAGTVTAHHESPMFRQIEGRLVENMPGWVVTQARASDGASIDIFYVHAQLATKDEGPPSLRRTCGVTLDSLVNRGHFRQTEYHMHTWLDRSDASIDSIENQPAAIAQSNFDDVFRDVVSYVLDVATVGRQAPKPLAPRDRVKEGEPDGSL